jgi:hypothetical protein
MASFPTKFANLARLTFGEITIPQFLNILRTITLKYKTKVAYTIDWMDVINEAVCKMNDKISFPNMHLPYILKRIMLRPNCIEYASSSICFWLIHKVLNIPGRKECFSIVYVSLIKIISKSDGCSWNLLKRSNYHGQCFPVSSSELQCDKNISNFSTTFIKWIKQHRYNFCHNIDLMNKAKYIQFLLQHLLHD